jgi:enoyl-[acyl-carrier protein] reductase I
MGLLDGKQALIVGVASNRSIAWAIADAMRREGAELAFAYQNERLGPRVRTLAMEAGSSLTFPCDVAKDEEIEALFSALERHWRHIDIIVHSVAFAPSEQLKGDYVDAVTREGFRTSHDISSYSFAALAKRGRALMRGRQSALLTLTYLGAVRSLPNYNVMGPAKASLEANVRYMARALGAEGIRVNAISAGPIRTLAAAGIGDFRRLMDLVAQNAALQRNVTAEEVGNAAVFLCSDLASGVTGEILYVDGGFSFSYGDPSPP